jgi:hypothetical protein
MDIFSGRFTSTSFHFVQNYIFTKHFGNLAELHWKNPTNIVGKQIWRNFPRSEMTQLSRNASEPGGNCFLIWKTTVTSGKIHFSVYTKSIK